MLRYPILPLRDIVVFPNMIVPLFVGRERSIAALEFVMKNDHQHILLVTQKNAEQDNPEKDDFFQVGTVANILQLLKLPDGTIKILAEGMSRLSIKNFDEEENHLIGEGEIIEEVCAAEEETEALIKTVCIEFENYVKMHRKIHNDVLLGLPNIDDPSKFADTIASHLALKIAQRQELLEISNVNERLERILVMMESEVGIMQVEKRIRTRVKRQMEKSQKEYYLNEQMKAIQKELGEDQFDDFLNFEEKIKNTKLSKEAKEKCITELRKLKMMPSTSSEANVVRNYLDCILDLPWKKVSKTKTDLTKAEAVLDQDHYGLEKVKERILEYLAVQSRTGRVKGQILCLVGPPGVGKTSLGKSIAHAIGRDYIRIALGGVRDEAEIRGHRRTYIGAQPGKFIQGLRKAKTSNPLFLLDEIDKMGQDWRGDPASALLEVLDPEQNNTFVDHYLEVEYDLSDVMFVTTANTLNLPQPLLDRMEVIRLSGYTEEEKASIADLYLVPRQIEQNGLRSDEITITKDAIKGLIQNYTRESGVRNLEREIANLCRKALRRVLSQKEKGVAITKENLKEFAGIQRFSHEEARQKDLVGVATGLAWTQVGGEILSIEVLLLPGKEKVIITGQLGDVMKESVHAAISYIRSKSKEFNIENEIFEKNDLHIHVPEGATPKDGPSAGITIFTAVISVLTKKPVRHDLAMTGEITLSGRVLQIGGLKEKLLAAHRGNIKTVLIPFDNEKDLEEIPDNIKSNMEIISVKTVDEVYERALVK
jgi:ATP-dependent Lon protease